MDRETPSKRYIQEQSEEVPEEEEIRRRVCRATEKERQREGRRKGEEPGDVVDYQAHTYGHSEAGLGLHKSEIRRQSGREVTAKVSVAAQSAAGLRSDAGRPEDGVSELFSRLLQHRVHTNEPY